MIIFDRQQIGLTRVEPIVGRRALALGAMAIAAGIVGDEGVRAILAARDVAAEDRRATVLDGRHGLELAETHMAGIGPTPGRPMGAEDIRDLQPFRGHGAPGVTRLSFSSPSPAVAPADS